RVRGGRGAAGRAGRPRRAARRDTPCARRRRAAPGAARAGGGAGRALPLGPQRGADDATARGGGALRVGIDARKIADFGIGTYIRNLLRELVTMGDEYVAFAPEHAALPDGV